MFDPLSSFFWRDAELRRGYALRGCSTYEGGHELIVILWLDPGEQCACCAYLSLCACDYWPLTYKSLPDLSSGFHGFVSWAGW